MEFGNVDQRKKALLDDLQGVDIAEEQRPLAGEEKLRKLVVTT